MLRSVQEMQGYALAATDGEMGRVHELLFDDEKWVVRYLVADTGPWLSGRKVLISPISVARIDTQRERVDVDLSMDRIRNGPDLSTDKPVSRQQEDAFYRYYGYGAYWTGASLWGTTSIPRTLVPPPGTPFPAANPDAAGGVPAGDSHLRSTREVVGYHIQATDEEAGHIDDFVVDDESWSIRHLVLDTSNWPGGRAVLIPPAWVLEVDWTLEKVHVKVPADQVRGLPNYVPVEILGQPDGAVMK